VDNARRQGERLRGKLETIQREQPSVDEIRGLGLMLGVEIVDAERRPDGDRAARLVKAAEARGLLMLRCGTHGQVVRWLPPLTVSAEEIDEGVAMFRAALDDV
jgi:4-aminobutyrate aminotransferase